MLTGHTGYVVKELYDVVYGQSVDNVKTWMEGTPVRVLNDQ